MVISGVFYIGLGDQFDERKLTAHVRGMVVISTERSTSFSLGKIGRIHHAGDSDRTAGLEYVDAADDSRIPSKFGMGAELRQERGL